MAKKTEQAIEPSLPETETPEKKEEEVVETPSIEPEKEIPEEGKPAEEPKKVDEAALLGDTALAIRSQGNPFMESDINYRGPLSYRYLRIIGWLFLVVSQLPSIFAINSAFGALPEMNVFLSSFLQILGAAMMPLFLVANFSLILRSRTSYKRTLILFGGLSIAVILGYYLFAERYIYAFARLTTETTDDAKKLVAGFFSSFFGGGINIFLDLFLCTVFAFFLNYKPKKFFQGKKIYIFRSFNILVVAYQVVAFGLKFGAMLRGEILPHWLLPWITAKPLIVFLAFIVIAIFVRLGQKKFIEKQHHTEAEYEEYAKTNRHSFRVSVTISIVFALATIVDFMVYAVAAAIISAVRGANTIEQITVIAEAVFQTGLGQGFSLFIIIPLILLFSYTRDHENKELDRFIPLGGIALLVLAYVEGLVHVISFLVGA